MSETPQEEKVLLDPEEIVSASGKSNKTGIIVAAILVIAIAASYGYSYWKKNFAVNLKPQAAQEKMEKFVTENLVPAGTKIESKEFKEESSIFKNIITIDGQEATVYMTKDGKKMFVDAIDMENFQKPEQEAPEAKEVSNKKDVPDVELFVMSYCPYGTQIEKGITPVIKALGSKVNFQLKFVNYILHDKVEADENVNQYCIQKEEPKKLVAYLDCFNKSGNTQACQRTAGINSAKLKTCVSKTDAEFKVTEAFNAGGRSPKFPLHDADNAKYNVKGSPTLVINGEKIASGRDSASLMKAICSGFSNQPEECKKEMSAQTPTAGFDSKSSGSTAAGNCQ